MKEAIRRERAKKVQLSDLDYWPIREIQKSIILADPDVDPALVSATKVASSIVRLFHEDLQGKNREAALKRLVDKIHG